MKKYVTTLLFMTVILLSQANIVDAFTIKNSKSSIETINNQTTTEVQNTTFSIVATQSFISDFVQNLVGDLFRVTSVVKGTEDPHSFSPKPSDVALIQSANIFFVYGVADIDGWTDTIIPALPASTTVVKLVNLEQDGKFDPYIGIGELNPHLWMSPTFVNSTIIQRIYDALVQIDPAHTQTYATNLTQYRQELGALIDRVKGNASIFNNLETVEYHAAFAYLLWDLNVTRLGAIEKIENQEPPASHIANMTEVIKSEIDAGKNVVIVQSLNLANDLTWQVARDTGAKVSYLVALMGSYPSQNFTSYIQMIDYDLVALANPVSPPTQAIPGFTIQNFLLIFIMVSIIKFKRKS